MELSEIDMSRDQSINSLPAMYKIELSEIHMMSCIFQSVVIIW